MASLTMDEVKWLFASFFGPELSYPILISTIKLSILVSYKRIFNRDKRTLIHIYVLMAFSCSWGIAVFFTFLFQCWPIEKTVNPFIEGHCFEFIPFLWAISVINFTIDWLILAIPIVPVWRLQMSRTQKMLATASFALGSLACIASTVRSATTSVLDPEDYSGSYFPATIWIWVEPNVGIVSACLPYFSKLFGARALAAINRAKHAASNLSLKFRRGYSQRLPADHNTELRITKQTVVSVTVPDDIHSARNFDTYGNYTAQATAFGKSDGESIQGLVQGN
ncbi:hypothetical protein EV127DRAFT_429258 [Xylaria flabelliformis]|nr:hypothetical protein EV127DRAFT_429258 [Xylaria flabelliformis]